MLDLTGDQLFATTRKLDEVDFKGTGRYIRYFVREAPELATVRDDLEDGHVELIEERGDLWGLSYALS